jgi:hypothetical protein
MDKQQFIREIAALVKKYAPSYGIKVYSPIIAQAVLESAYGTSELAVNACNYFGLKYRKGRCKTCIGIYNKVGSEQNKDGSYTSSLMEWCKFADMENGVIGYFDFINISNYANLKGVTEPREYLEKIKADRYATSHDYVENLLRVISDWKLTDYDEKEEKEMSNSPLVSYTKLSPNHSGQRTHSVDRITPHCVVGQLSAESICACFPAGRDASCNYGIGTDGRIALCVEEKNRSWCSSNKANDQRAITIECASEKSEPYAMNSKVYASLINLCVDICKRYNKKKLIWFGDKTKTLNYSPKSDEMILTVHRWFANKSCPGNWLYSRMGELAAEVTKRLGGTTTTTPTTPTTTKHLYRVRKAWSDAKSQKGAYSVLENAKAMADKNPGYSVYDESGNVVYAGKSTTTQAFKPYLVRVTTDVLNIRKGAGTNYGKNGAIRDRGVYTIVAESTGKGASKWGKLKSGAGWISLDYTKRV